MFVESNLFGKHTRERCGQQGPVVMEHGHAVDPTSAPGYEVASGSSAAIRTVIRELDAAALTGDAAGYTPEKLAAAAQQICAAARRDGLYVEQALVRVKDVWRSTPGRLKPRSGGSDVRLDQLVSACIREFYTER